MKFITSIIMYCLFFNLYTLPSENPTTLPANTSSSTETTSNTTPATDTLLTELLPTDSSATTSPTPTIMPQPSSTDTSTTTPTSAPAESSPATSIPLEQPSTGTSSTISATTEQTPTANTASAKTPVTTTEKNALQKWQDHLKALLVKGAFWDSTSQIPTSDWQDNALSIAREVIIDNSSASEELKSSFLTTMNDKFINIEKGTDLTAVATIINDFNKKIDDLVNELSSVPTPIETPAGAATETVPSETSPITTDTAASSEATPEPTPEPETPIMSEDEQAAKKKEDKLKTAWQECIDSIESEGLIAEEAQGILNDLAVIAPKIIETFPSDINTFKNDLITALDIRKSNALVQFNNSDIQNILHLFGVDIAQSDQGTSANTDSTAQQTPEPNTQESSSTDTPTAQPTTKTTTSVETVTVITQNSNNPSTTTGSSSANKKMQEQKSQLQKSLALRIELAAQQKAQEEKTKAQQGILSSIAQTVLGEWWTGPNVAEQTAADLVEQQAKNLENIIDPVLSDDIKNKIKIAYDLFQKTLLNFDSKEYWDAEKSIPNTLWIKRMAATSFVLINYKIMPLEAILKAIDTTFATNKTITLTASKSVQSSFIAMIKKSENKEKDRYLGEQKKQEKIAQEQRRIEEEKKQEEQRKQNEIKRAEQEKVDLEKKKEDDKLAAINQLKQELEPSWQKLIEKIKASKPATLEQNETWTNEALAITKSMINLIPIAGNNNQKEIIEKHIADISNAFIAQQKNNDDAINVHINIESFNKAVHQ